MTAAMHAVKWTTHQAQALRPIPALTFLEVAFSLSVLRGVGSSPPFD